MQSSPFGSTNGGTTSGMACHHYLWTAHTVEGHWAWHDITALGLNARSDDVGRGMTSLPLGSTHSRQRRAWHDITAFGQHIWSNDVRCGMPSSPLDNTHGRTTSGVACYHRLWAAQTVGRRRAWHTITALGQHKWSDDVGRGMPSPPLDSTHGRTTSA